VIDGKPLSEYKKQKFGSVVSGREQFIVTAHETKSDFFFFHRRVVCQAYLIGKVIDEKTWDRKPTHKITFEILRESRNKILVKDRARIEEIDYT